MVFHSQSDRKLVLAGGILATATVGFIWWRRSRKNKHRKQFELNMLEKLHQPWVHIRDPEKVEKILSNMIQDGTDHLQIITDFDRTLSAYKMNGKMVDTCHQALDHSPVLPEGYREKACDIRDTYYPIEIDTNRTVAEKTPYMVEWWTKAHQLLVQSNFTKPLLKKVVSDSNIILRDGSIKMFEDLYRHQVPLLIFSAGIGDIIEEVVNQKAHLHDNMKIVSNYMDFNSQGQLVGFQGELIHTFNKNKSAIHKSDYFHSIKRRGNLILLGDSMGDLNMAEGACDVRNILKIGFLNDKIDASLEKYKASYDIVLVSDETMDIPNSILTQIFS